MISTDAVEAWTRLLTEQNVVGHLQLVTGQTPVDFITGLSPAATLTDVDLVGFASSFDRDEIDGTVVLSTDVKLTIDGATVVAKKNTIKIGGKTHRVQDVREVNFVGQLAGYIVRARL